MEETTNLKLPLLVPNQSQKEITHNEALVILDNLVNNGVKDKDLTTPPENPSQNDLYIVGVGASGEWEGKDNQLAFYDNGWRFCQARQGTKYWVIDENCIYVFNMTSWSKFSGGGSSGGGEGGEGGATSLSQLDDVSLNSISQDDILKFSNGVFTNSKELNNLTGLGINCECDNDNKLAIKSNYVLFDNNGGDSKIKANKSTTTQTASHLFQNNYSGRAEFGLIGNDDFSLKVSSDGSEWKEAFVVDKTTGNIDFKGEITKNGESMVGGSGGNLELLDEILITNGDVSITFNGLNDSKKHIFIFDNILSNQNTNLNARFISGETEIDSNIYNYCLDALWIIDNTNIQHQVKGQNSINCMSFLASVISENLALVSDYPTSGYIETYGRSVSGNFIKQFGAYNSLVRIQCNSGININANIDDITAIKFFLYTGNFKSGKIKHYRII